MSVIILTKAMRVYYNTRMLANLYLAGICSGFSVTILLNLVAKILVKFFNVAFQTAAIFDKLSLLSMFMVSVSAVICTIELFKSFTEKKTKTIIIIYIALYLPVFIHIMFNLTADLSAFFYGAHMVFLFSSFIYLAANSYIFMKKTEDELAVFGTKLITYSVLFLIFSYIVRLLSMLLISLDLTQPFGILYIVRYMLMSAGFGIFYLGFFLPRWLKRLKNLE